MIWRRWSAAPACGLALVLTGCDECAGTPSCHNPPMISYSGQVIDHRTGSPIAGVTFAFVRDSGVSIVADTVRAVSDGSGFFQLRVGAFENGTVQGHMRVAGPPPYAPYVMPSLSLTTTLARGDGGSFGRLVVKPYLLLLGHVRDRETLTPLADLSVKMRWDSGGRLSADSMTFTTDAGGQFAWYPEVVDPEPLHVTFEITRAGDPQPKRIRRTLAPLYRDGEMSFQILPFGTGFPYFGFAGRRGFATPAPGTSLRFRRLGGIDVEPRDVVVALSSDGAFRIPMKPLFAGTLQVELTILPPAPYAAESRTLTLETSDDDFLTSLGFFGYGAHVFVTTQLRDAATNAPLPSGTIATFKRVAGLELQWPTPAEGDLRIADATGRLLYGAPTADSGQVVFEVIVRLPAPFARDTIRGVSIPARFNDVPFDAGVLRVRRRPAP